MPSPSKTIRGDTVIIGDRSFESLAAEFGDLVPPVAVDTPPKGAATIRDIARVWKLGELATRRRVYRLIDSGQMKLAGRFRVTNGARGVYPIAHYVRVRK